MLGAAATRDIHSASASAQRTGHPHYWRKRMKVVVTTPTGNIGSKLTRVLLDRGAELTVIARHPEKVKDVESRGAKIVAGDHSNATVVQGALQGADALFFLVPPSYTSRDPIGDYQRFGDAAATAVAKYPKLHVVLLSSVGAHRPDGTGLIKGLHQAEERLREVAKNLTILRANYFMENIMGSLPTIVKDGNIYSIVSGTSHLPQVATADIARVAADILLAPTSDQSVVDLVGPEDLRFDQAAAIIATGLGKKVQHTTVSPEAITPVLVGEGFSQEVAREFVEMEQAIDRNLGNEFEGDEQRRGTITFQQFVRDTLMPAYQQARTAAA
jgi:uncharacterized protein YbjT (DUF2867 family)